MLEKPLLIVDGEVKPLYAIKFLDNWQMHVLMGDEKSSTTLHKDFVLLPSMNITDSNWKTLYDGDIVNISDWELWSNWIVNSKWFLEKWNDNLYVFNISEHFEKVGNLYINN